MEVVVAVAETVAEEDLAVAESLLQLLPSTGSAAVVAAVDAAAGTVELVAFGFAGVWLGTFAVSVA